MIFRILFAALLLSGVASAQNVKTVMADTNGVIRGNAALEARIATGGTGAASTNDLAAVSNRVVAVEAGTNNWNAAYGWGNHAGAGYLTSFAETDPFFTAWRGTNTYVKVEQDTTALGVIATQRVSRIELDGRIIDATNGVWQVSPATSTNWYFTETYNNITTALPQLAYPLPADFYVEMQRGGSTYFTISCMTDLPTYDRYTGIEVFLSPGGALGTYYVNSDPFNGFDGWFSDPEFIVRNVILFWKVEPTGGLATNHVGTLALQSAVDAKADADTTISINGVSGNLSSNNVWATPSIASLALTNGLTVFGGWSNVYPTVTIRWGTTNFNIVIKAP